MADAQTPFVGKALTERSFLIDAAVQEHFHAGLALPRRADGLLPSTIASAADNDYFEEIAFADRFGHLWMRQEHEFFLPLETGKRYRSRGRIIDIYPRRNRNVVNYEVELLNEAGAVAQRCRHHQSFLAQREASPALALRPADKKPGARRFEVPPGEPFGGLERAVTLEMCGAFFHGDANYHTNREASAALGFRDVVVGGRMTMAWVAHICEAAFGPAWWTQGRLDVKFTNPVWPGDVVTARGVKTGRTPDAPPRQGAFAWLAKADGTVALVAQASVAA